MICVLYVDDEPALLDIAKRFLEKNDEISVETMNSATQGLEQLDVRNYDVIVSDYQMPQMDGIEFLKKVRTTYGDVPFILFTGKGREEVVIDAINNGADFYLQKGGEVKSQYAELAHKIKQVVRRTNVEGLLHQSEIWFQSIIRYSEDIVTLLNQDGLIVYSSPPGEKILGYATEFLTGKRFLDLIHPGDAKAVTLVFSGALSNDNQTSAIQYRIRRADGTYLDVESVLTGSPDVPEMRGYIMTTRDISVHKKVENELREELSRLHRAEKMTRSGWFEFSPGTRVFTLSDGAKSIYGVDCSVVAFEDIESRVIFGSQPGLNAAISSLIEKSCQFDIEYNVRRNGDDPGYPVRSTAVYDPDKNTVFGVIYELTR